MRVYTCHACGGWMRRRRRFSQRIDPIPAEEWAEFERAWEEYVDAHRAKWQAQWRTMLDALSPEARAHLERKQSRLEEDKKTPDERKAALVHHLEQHGYAADGWKIVADNPYGVVMDKGRSRMMIEVDEWGEITGSGRGREYQEWLERPVPDPWVPRAFR